MRLLKTLVFFLILCSIIIAKDYKIAILVDGISPSVKRVVESIKMEILDLTINEFNVAFPDELYIDGQWDYKTIDEGLTALLGNQQADIIITIGVVSSFEASTRGNLEKAVVAPFILDARLLNLPKEDGKSAIKNLNFIDIPSTVERDITFLNSLFPQKKLLVLINDLFLETIPDLEERFQKLASQASIAIEVMPLGRDIEKVKESFPQNIDGVYYAPLVHLEDKQREELIRFVNSKKLPSLTVMGQNDVELGVLYSLRADFFPRISRRIALNVQQILIGGKAHNLSVDFNPAEKIVINMATAREIGYYPDWDILTEAQQLNADVPSGGELFTITDAIETALKENLDIRSRAKELDKAAQEVKSARSLLLPQINLSATGLIIDKDRAESSLGSQPEKSINAGVNAQQLLFSEQAWANFSIQKDIYLSREKQYKQYQLDLIYNVASAYLNVLRAQAGKRIQQENLKRTRQNLAQAKVRESVGTSGPAEVYRWESQQANNKRSLFEANATLNLARVQLLEILNKPLEENIMLQEQDNRSDMLRRAQSLADRYITNPHLFNLFREYVTQQALQNAPELAALDAAIAARERALSSAKNNMWMPTLALQAEYSRRLEESGAGTEGPDFSGLPFPVSFPSADKENWSVALNLSFPLFKGGAKFSDLYKADEELNQAKLQREAYAKKIEQRIRSAIFASGSSYPSVEQSRLATEAARKSFEIMQDAYLQGSINLIDLLDAQNNFLISEQIATDAVYTFLLDLINIERAASRRYMTYTDNTYNDFVTGLEKYYSEQGVELK